MMKLWIAVLLALPLQVCSFLTPVERGVTSRQTNGSRLFGYIPDGMTPEQWKKLKEQEKQNAAKKKYGAYGPQSFKSRSMLAFQKELEAGKTSHLLPMFNAKEKMKAGKIKPEDIPYMQRGGAWDNSDVGAKKKQWTAYDKKYDANQAPETPDWMGNVQRRSPQQQAKKNTTAETEKPKKKLFGLF